MNRTTWEIFQGATLSLARSGALKDRLTDAYRNHLAAVNESELPRELREDFRLLNDALKSERRLLRGEDAVRATIRKMSNEEAEAAAALMVNMCCALQRGSGFGPFRTAPSTTLRPLLVGSERAAVEREREVPAAADDEQHQHPDRRVVGG